MAILDDILERVTSNTNFLNSIIANAKKIFELPAQTVLDLESKLHVSNSTNDSEHVTIQQIVDSVDIDSQSVIANIDTTYDLDWSKGNSNLTMTANTVFSEINLPNSGVEKTITIYLYGVFSATLPVAWGVIGDAYDGVNGSQIVVHWKGDGTYHAVRNNLV